MGVLDMLTQQRQNDVSNAAQIHGGELSPGANWGSIISGLGRGLGQIGARQPVNILTHMQRVRAEEERREKAKRQQAMLKEHISKLAESPNLDTAIQANQAAMQPRVAMAAVQRGIDTPGGATPLTQDPTVQAPAFRQPVMDKVEELTRQADTGAVLGKKELQTLALLPDYESKAKYIAGKLSDPGWEVKEVDGDLVQYRATDPVGTMKTAYTSEGKPGKSWRQMSPTDIQQVWPGLKLNEGQAAFWTDKGEPKLVDAQGQSAEFYQPMTSDEIDGWGLSTDKGQVWAMNMKTRKPVDLTKSGGVNVNLDTSKKGQVSSAKAAVESYLDPDMAAITDAGINNMALLEPSLAKWFEGGGVSGPFADDYANAMRLAQSIGIDTKGLASAADIIDRITTQETLNVTQRMKGSLAVAELNFARNQVNNIQDSRLAAYVKMSYSKYAYLKQENMAKMAHDMRNAGASDAEIQNAVETYRRDTRIVHPVDSQEAAEKSNATGIFYWYDPKRKVTVYAVK